MQLTLDQLKDFFYSLGEDTDVFTALSNLDIGRLTNMTLTHDQMQTIIETVENKKFKISLWYERCLEQLKCDASNNFVDASDRGIRSSYVIEFSEKYGIDLTSAEHNRYVHELKRDLKYEN